MLQAAAHVHRFLSLDENLLREPGPDPKKADSFASSMHVLQQASSDLQQVIIEGFDRAVVSKDHVNIERFARRAKCIHKCVCVVVLCDCTLHCRYVKLFPLLNLHSEGLKKFSCFVCEEVCMHGTSP